MKLENYKLVEITGGAWNASVINAVVRLIGSLVDIGRMIGSSLRRAISGQYCQI